MKLFVEKFAHLWAKSAENFDIKLVIELLILLKMHEEGFEPSHRYDSGS